MREVLPVVAAVAVVLSGCADGPTPPAGPSPTGTSPTGPSAPPSTPTTDTSAEGTAVTVRGTVARGVEAGCLVLATGQREYLLLRAGPELRPGAEVVVRGRTRPAMPTTCMQGVPLVVEEVEPVRAGPS
ncbi:hypothetical protein [Saccharomonospora saliphila]|uniref:hypothetical protein n=1 Tax=Saccharomonospora saliphila TaxID=369829 RepID=UPI00036F16C2|nr:hypothetical protein [Saccharomonospora saliphila]